MTARHLSSRLTWRKALSAVASLAVVVTWFVVLRPAVFGGPATYSIVSGHSMEPTFEPGDYVVALTREDYAVGDIVMFGVPGGVVIHRIVGGSAEIGFITRGDNNKAVDPWRPSVDSILGEAWLHVPKLGSLIAIARGPIGIGVMAWVLTTLVVLHLTTPKGRHLSLQPKRERGGSPRHLATGDLQVYRSRRVGQ